MLTRLHHVGIVVKDLEETRNLLHGVFGLEVARGGQVVHVDSDNVDALDFLIGESGIEANMPKDTVSGTARFMERRGQGLHHICFYSDDIDADVARLKEAGLQQIGETTAGEPGGSRVAWFHPRTSLGILIELWQDV